MPAAYRVLCVDDNHDAADSTAMLLKAAGFEARACYGGPDALREAAAFRPDLCFIDLNMPGMDGDVLAGRLREQAADRPPLMVALTAMSGEQSARRILAAGFDLHMVKPADPRNLVEVLRNLSSESGDGGEGPTRSRPVR